MGHVSGVKVSLSSILSLLSPCRQRNITHASADIARQDLGYDGECSVTFPGFEERDVATGEALFKWDATGKIPLSDSTMAFEPVEHRCTGGTWDYLLVSTSDILVDFSRPNLS